MITRRQFLQFAATVRLKPDTTYGGGHDVRLKPDTTCAGGRGVDAARRGVRLQPDQGTGKPRGSEFVFARLRYESGDWDYNPKVAANVLDSILRCRSFFTFTAGPPQTSHELNGWGGNIVHEYLKGIDRRGRLAVLYSNKDYGCEWDDDWRNKRFLREDNTRFAVNIVVCVMG